MEFVYLQRVQSEHGERLLPSTVNDEIALLKARTLLYVLAEKQLLDRSITGNVAAYTPKQNLAIKSIVIPGLNFVENVEAVIPILPFKPIWEQPGVAYVLDGLENQTLFMSYLMSSKRWLDSHPGLRDNIENKLLEVAS